jgi:DNA-binding NtrC family response regulator
MGGSDSGEVPDTRVFAHDPQTGVRPVVPVHDAKASEAPRPSRRRLHILVVDDEPRFLESLSLALGDDHHVETSVKATVALELLADGTRPQQFDIVLCDLAMPDVDGVTFYERMVGMGIGDRFVLMTGGAFAPRAAAFVESRTCPTIIMPFLLERLLRLLDHDAENEAALR